MLLFVFELPSSSLRYTLLKTFFFFFFLDMDLIKKYFNNDSLFPFGK